MFLLSVVSTFPTLGNVVPTRWGFLHDTGDWSIPHFSGKSEEVLIHHPTYQTQSTTTVLVRRQLHMLYPLYLAPCFLLDSDFYACIFERQRNCVFVSYIIRVACQVVHEEPSRWKWYPMVARKKDAKFYENSNRPPRTDPRPWTPCLWRKSCHTSIYGTWALFQGSVGIFLDKSSIIFPVFILVTVSVFNASSLWTFHGVLTCVQKDNKVWELEIISPKTCWLQRKMA